MQPHGISPDLNTHAGSSAADFKEFTRMRNRSTQWADKNASIFLKSAGLPPCAAVRFQEIHGAARAGGWRGRALAGGRELIRPQEARSPRGPRETHLMQ
jgi:hypothetical protein